MSISVSVSARLTHLAWVSCLLLAGCAQAFVKPPYADEPASKSQAPCPTQNGSSTDDCKKSQSK